MIREPRFSSQDAREIIGRIPALKKLLNVEEEDGVTPVRDTISSKAFVYMCRFNQDGGKRITDDGKNIAQQESEEYSLSADSESVSVVQKPYSVKFLDKKRRFAMSLASLSAKPEKRLDIVKDGAIAALIELSSIHDNFIQRSCSVAFSQLAAHSSDGIRGRLIDEGACAAIVSLSNSSDYDVKVDCCQALCNITAEPGSEFRASKDGVAYAAIHIATTFPEYTDMCLTILLNLSCVPDKYARIEDVSEALIHFQATSLTPKQEELILSTLCNLSALRNNQLRLVEDGCIKLVEHAWKSANLNLKKLAADILRNLTTEYKSRGKLLEQDVLSLLLSMARDPNEETLISVIKALYNLSKDALCRLKFASTGPAIEAVLRVGLQKYNNFDIARVAAKTLKILCGDMNTSVKLVRLNLVEALLSLLSFRDNVTQQYCIECLCAALEIEAVHKNLIEQNAVKIIIDIFQYYDSTGLEKIPPFTSELCAFSIYSIIIFSISDPISIENHILPCLIKLCDTTSEVRTKVICAAAIANITFNKSVNSSNAIPLLVRILRSEGDQAAKTLCATSLYNLAESHENCELMLAGGALAPMVDLTSSDYIATRVKCAAILSRLAMHESYNQLFEQGGVLKVLLDLSNIDDIVTQRRIVIALSNLSQNDSLMRQLNELNPIPYLISLAAKRDEQLWRAIMSIVCNLSSEPGTEKGMVDGGIIPTILITALVNAKRDESKIICVKCLVNLLADESLHAAMVKQGLIWGISALALLDNAELVQLCASSLCLLSGKFGREMINSGAAVRAVFKLINLSDVELQRLGARSLMNILMITNDSDEKFRNLVVVNMKKLTENKDEEVVEMCIICLCLVSQSESCRPAIVASNMLRMIDASSIFTVPTVSYAYLTMFGNIANNPKMRTELLDDQSIPRFRHICLSGDPNLDMATIKAIYNITCAPENIATLTEQNILQIVDIVWTASYQKLPELVHHLTAILYNISIDPSVQARVVSQGIVALYVSFWHSPGLEGRVKKLICSGICHLACGNVNSNRMVSDGCTPILVYVAKAQSLGINSSSGNNVGSGSSSSAFHKQLSSLTKAESGFAVTGNMSARCAAGIRNLLCAALNQPIMIEEGIVTSLIDLFHGADAHQGRESIRKNCAVALRSLTFNKDLRTSILETEAINIILTDLSDQMDDDLSPSINKGLLKQLEAESWVNGVRGSKREGRAASIPPSTLYADLIASTLSVQLDVGVRSAEIVKHRVSQTLHDAAAEEAAAGSQRNVQVGEDVDDVVGSSSTSSESSKLSPVKKAKSAVVDDFNVTYSELVKKKQSEEDEGSSTILMQCPKLQCEVEFTLKLKNNPSNGLAFETLTEVIDDSDRLDLTSPRDNSLSIANVAKLPTKKPTDSLPELQKKINDFHLSSQFQLFGDASTLELPRIAPPAVDNRQPKEPGVSRIKASKKASDPQKNFDKLVSLIKHSKSANGASIGDVLNEWSKSKF